MFLTSEFKRNIEQTFGHDGSEWLVRLPEIITECERRWSLKVGPSFSGLSYNYVAPAEGAEGKEIVLKLGVARSEVVREIEALRVYAGRGSVQLLDSIPDQGIMLLERLRPGLMASDLCPANDDEATRIAAKVMRQLWRNVAPDSGFKKIEEWFEGLAQLRKEFKGGCGPFPRHLVEMAELLYEDLSQSVGEPVLLHGDLHHYNILSATREPWLAIDPKGVVGEAVYDVGALLRNPVPDVLDWPDLEGVLRRRSAILTEVLEVDRQRVLGWGLAQAVLSAWWSYTDNDSEWWAILPVAEHLSKILSGSMV